MQVEELLGGLPALETLCLRGCPSARAEAVAGLSERFPGVHILRGDLG